MVMQHVVAVVVLCLAGGQVEGSLTAAGSSVLCKTMLSAIELGNGTVASYECIGSGNGKSALLAGEVDFSASDSVLTPEDFEQYPDLQMVPITVSPIGVVYHVPGVTTLVLTREILVRIFLGTATHWDDTEIAALNPTASLPHALIEPVVRQDKSGSTEIFTRALSSFSDDWSHSISSTWPSTARAFTASEGGSGILNYVKTTSYTISYRGMDGVSEAGVSFAVIKNKVGTPTLPGWADGDATAAGFNFDNETLVTDLKEGLGYPITGVTYIIFRRSSATLCKVIEWLHWMLHDTQVDVAISQAGLVPSAAHTRNMALSRMASDTCSELLQSPFDATAGETDWNLMNSFGYGLSLGNSQKYLRLRDDAHVSLTVGNTNKAAFPVALEGVEMAVNFGIDISSIELSIEDMGRILTGEISFWNDTRLRSRSSFLPASDMPVKVVTDSRMVYYKVMLETLRLDDCTPHLVLSDASRVADYVKANPYTFAVTSSQQVQMWKLSRVQPVYQGVPTPTYSSVTSNMPALQYNRETFRISVPLSTVVHPFFRVVNFEVTRNVVAPNACQRDHFELISYALGPEGQDIMASAGLVVLTSVIEDLKTVQLATLRCNGELLVPAESGPNTTAWIIAGSVAGCVLSIIICCLAAHWMNERKKRHMMLSENIYAAQSISEALVAFDLEVAKRSLAQCQLPVTLNKAFTSLISNLESYRAYLPDSCLHGNSEDDIAVSNSETYTDITRQQETLSGGSSGSLSSSQVVVARKIPRAELRTRKVSLAVVNIVGYHGADDIRETLGKYLLLIAKMVSDTNGIRDGFSGDRVYLSWNGAKGNINHVLNAGKAVRMITQACEKENIVTTTGLSTGEVRCGVMGTEKMKKFTMVGPVVGWVCALERFNKVYETQMLTDSVDIKNAYYVYLVDRVCFPKFKRETMDIYSIGDEKEVLHNEWMYQLQEHSHNDPHRSHNAGMRSYLNGNFSEAKSELLAIDSPQPRALQVIQTMNKSQGGVKLLPTTVMPLAYF